MIEVFTPTDNSNPIVGLSSFCHRLTKIAKKNVTQCDLPSYTFDRALCCAPQIWKINPEKRGEKNLLLEMIVKVP